MGVSLAEIGRLRELLGASEEERRYHFAWSAWRRTHQAIAQVGHERRHAPQDELAATTSPRPAMRTTLPPPSEEQWAQILALLAEADQTARVTPLPHRPILEGLLWMMERGARLQDIPEQYGAWKTIESRYRRWCARGIWTQLLAILLPDDRPTGSSS